jgi:2-iminobutanoate/2-iminopropanoate deaminase
MTLTTSPQGNPMFKAHNPEQIAQPLSPTYVNAMEVAAGGRWLYVSGQLGIDPSGATVRDYEGQCHRVWMNILELLASANMTVGNIVKMNAFVVHGQDMAAYGRIRGEYLAGHKPASTLIAVPALARPEFLVEVEVVACAGE